MREWQDNFKCDFCNVFIENDGEGSAFVDGSAFSNVGVDDRIACPDCCGQIKEEFECVDCGEYPLVFEGDNEYEPDPITGEKRCFKCHIKESR